jgi:hypothetical protein
MSSVRPEGLVTLQMLAASETLELTLLELVRAITESTSDDREVVATVVHLLRSGRVRLRGNFRGTVLDAA